MLSSRFGALGVSVAVVSAIFFSVTFTHAQSTPRSLYVGLRGDDVAALQVKLIARGFLDAGNDTGYFGPLTRAAVQQFQRQHGIVSSGDEATTGYGSYGPITRAALENKSVQSATGAQTSSNAAATASSLQSLIAELQSLIQLVNQLSEQVQVSNSSLTTPTVSSASSVSCSFNGQTVANGQSISAFQGPLVTTGGPCVSQLRTCSNGTLSGTYQYASCGVEAAATTANTTSCTFNGQTVANGHTVIGYQAASVAKESQCLSQQRTCTNGTLSGTYQYASCDVEAAATTNASCTFNGQTVASGQSVTAYKSSSVASGNQCVLQTRTCQNGTLSGSYQYANCAVNNAAASCTFNGQTVANGQSVTAYQSSVGAIGSQCVSQQRTCANGTLSGTYQLNECSASTASSCTFNGKTIASGSSVVAYQSSSVASGSQCVLQTRTCSNGTLSGSYQYANCAVNNAAASCTFNGQTVANGQSVTAYQSSVGAKGSQCVSQQRTCANGTLSGTYQLNECPAGTASSCTFNGQTVANGQSVTAYQSSSVASGNQCVLQTRTCQNGTLSGSYQYANCAVNNAAASCTFNGQTVASGQSVTAYQSSSVASGNQCVSQTRTCSNGTLSGTYTNASCAVQSQSQACQPPRHYQFSSPTGYSLQCAPSQIPIFSVTVPDTGRAIARATIAVENWSDHAYYWAASVHVGSPIYNYAVGDDICTRSYGSAANQNKSILGYGTLSPGNQTVTVNAYQGSYDCSNGAMTTFSGNTLDVWVEDDSPACVGKDIVVKDYYADYGFTNIFQWQTYMTPMLQIQTTVPQGRSSALLLSSVEATPDPNPNTQCGSETATFVTQQVFNGSSVALRSQVSPGYAGMSHIVLALESTVHSLVAGANVVAQFLVGKNNVAPVTTGGCCGDGVYGIIFNQ